MPSLCFSRFQNVIKHVDRRVLSEVHGFRTTSISLIFASHILGEVNQQELADDLLHAGFALKPDFIDLLLLDLLPVSRRILFIFLELSVELSNEGRVHVISQRIVKLSNSVRVKFVLLFGEEFVLSSRVHHEAFFQGLTHIFVVAHNDLSVRVTQINSHFNARGLNLLDDSIFNFELIYLTEVSLSLNEHLIFAALSALFELLLDGDDVFINFRSPVTALNH